VEPIRILLADDHTLVREGIRALVEKLPTVTVVGEAKDGREALRLVKEHKPDLVLMDIAMPGLNGLEATARISKEVSTTRVIILSMYANEEYIREAIRAGAAGYMVKRGAAAELEQAITAVARGETYFSPLISTNLTKDRRGRVSADRAWIARLTPRQREILQLIAERHSTKDIAGHPQHQRKDSRDPPCSIDATIGHSRRARVGAIRHQGWTRNAGRIVTRLHGRLIARPGQRVKAKGTHPG
jgi:DNA-binding NarL/FixJ family response regulator